MVRSNARLSSQVQMHTCHHHKNQLFWFDGAVLKTDYDHSLCLDYHPSTPAIMYWLWKSCFATAQIQPSPFHEKIMQHVWLFGTEWHFCSGTSDLYFHACHSGDNQKFVWSGEQIKARNIWEQGARGQTPQHLAQNYEASSINMWMYINVASEATTILEDFRLCQGAQA